MALGFDWRGLFAQFGGELNVYSIVVGIARYQVTQHGPQGYAIRTINRIRQKFGISQREAGALFSHMRQIAEDAHLLNTLNRQEDFTDEITHTSPNVLGDADTGDTFVVSGGLEILDDYGDVVRRIPFVEEFSGEMSVDELHALVAEHGWQFLEKYEEELAEGLQGGGLTVGDIHISFVARRGKHAR